MALEQVPRHCLWGPARDHHFKPGTAGFCRASPPQALPTQPRGLERPFILLLGTTVMTLVYALRVCSHAHSRAHALIRAWPDRDLETRVLFLEIVDGANL